MFSTTTKQNAKETNDSHASITVKATFSYLPFFSYYINTYHDLELPDYYAYYNTVNHIQISYKMDTYGAAERMLDNYIYTYAKPGPRLWKFIKDTMNKKLQESIWSLYDYQDYLNNSTGQCHTFECIYDELEGVWEDSVGLAILKQYNTWRSKIHQKLEIWTRLSKKYNKGQQKRRAEEKIKNFIVSRMFDTKYKIGRHFFEYRLKQDGLEYDN